MEFIKPGTQFDFMSKRWLFVGISAVAVLIAIISVFVPGPRLGTDFKGGTEVEVAFTKPVDGAQVRHALEKSGFEAPDVVSAENPTMKYLFLIRVQEVSAISDARKQLVRERLCFAGDDAEPTADCPKEARAAEVKFSPGGERITVRYDAKPDLAKITAQMTGIEGVNMRTPPRILDEHENKVEIALTSTGDQLVEGLRKELGADTVPETAERLEWIGPKAGEQLRDAAIISIGLSILFIMAYIAFRFDLRFAPGGIIALVHDVAIALGAMILTGREVTLTTVAALLTIVGYSITDTVVVYDRIRENLGKHRGMSFAQIVNLSVSEMLGRTIITGGVTALSMVCFLFWGTGALKDFAFCLLVGMVAGMYSSIYVAAPATEWIDRRFFGSTVLKPKKVSRTRGTKRADAVV